MANQSQNCGDPSLCANNCGFFGNPSTNDLCSKCYKEYLMKHSKERGDPILSSHILGDQKNEENEQQLEEHVVEQVVSNESVNEVGGSGTCSEINAANRAANRCNLCKKKVGLTGFKCKCGHTFCSLHRYSDKHNCVFDYKGAGQDAIARANPVVKADKIEKI